MGKEHTLTKSKSNPRL